MTGETLAYGPWVAALRAQADWLLDKAGPADPLTSRHGACSSGCSRCFRGMSADAPLLLVLEDMHWADESSRMLLGFLAVRLRDQPVLVVATLRGGDLEDEALTWLAELERCPRVTRLRLAARAAAIARLVIGFPGGVGDPSDSVVGAAGGNPFYAEELARSPPHWPPVPLAEAIRAKVASASHRFARWSPRRVGDDGVSHEVSRRTTPYQNETSLRPSAEPSADTCSSRPSDGYAIPHELTRQVLYEDLLPGERRLMHRRLATALAADEAVIPPGWPGTGT